LGRDLLCLGTVIASVTGCGTGLDVDPRCSRKIAKVVFESNMALSGAADGTATGSANIWVINTDGSGLEQLTYNSGSSLYDAYPNGTVPASTPACSN
jgi:hypothetical protein